METTYDNERIALIASQLFNINKEQEAVYRYLNNFIHTDAFRYDTDVEIKNSIAKLRDYFQNKYSCVNFYDCYKKAIEIERDRTNNTDEV